MCRARDRCGCVSAEPDCEIRVEIRCTDRLFAYFENGAESYEQMKKILNEKGGFVRCYFNPDRANEKRIKDETKATVRCVPFEQPGTEGKDILTGQETKTQVLFAVAY